MSLPEPFATYAANRLANADKPDRGRVWIESALKDRFQADTALHVCTQCGVMRRRDDNNKPCVGLVKVTLR